MSTLWIPDTSVDTDGIFNSEDAGEEWTASPSIKVIDPVDNHVLYDLRDKTDYKLAVVVRKNPSVPLTNVVCSVRLGRAGFYTSASDVTEEIAGVTPRLLASWGVSGAETTFVFDTWRVDMGLGTNESFHGCLLAKVEADGFPAPAQWWQADKQPQCAQHNINVIWSGANRSPQVKGVGLAAANLGARQELRTFQVAPLRQDSPLVQRVLASLRVQYPARRFAPAQVDLGGLGLDLGARQRVLTPQPVLTPHTAVDPRQEPNLIASAAPAPWSTILDLPRVAPGALKRSLQLPLLPGERRTVVVRLPEASLPPGGVLGLHAVSQNERGITQSGVALILVGGERP